MVLQGRYKLVMSMDFRVWRVQAQCTYMEGSGTKVGHMYGQVNHMYGQGWSLSDVCGLKETKERLFTYEVSLYIEA